MPKTSILPVREKAIEAYLKRLVKKLLKGLCEKLINIGDTGWPDRKVIVPPYGYEYWVELKKPKGGVLSPKQKIVHRRLRAMGVKVYVLWTKQDVEDFIKMIKLDLQCTMR